MTYAISGMLGVNFTERSTTPTVDLGTTVLGANGSQWVYVKAGEAVAQYDVVAVDEAYSALKLTKALADVGHKIGAASAAFAANEYGWVQSSGVTRINVLASCAADVALYTSATAGSLDDSSSSQTKIKGVVLTTARGGSNGDAPALAAVAMFADI